jgi:magnesium transporter
MIQGMMLGFVLGIIGFVRVLVWAKIVPGVYGAYDVRVAFTVGFALLGVVLWGTLSGSMLPIVLKKLGADPAVSSAPFVATLVDVTGLVIYFSFAYLFLHGILL